ncbi:MAG TPA: site-2 protease family protein [Thermodesulfobacteriota bacterium]|nr:site-2 protease family protein [Thermodesulfobacteriota bacterium]
MFGKRIKLFTLFGFEVRIDLSWVIIAVLVVWSLAVGFFPFHYKNLSSETYWLMGVAGAVGLFLSIIFHEIFHSLVARRFGIPMKGITLFVFGGVSEMGEEPPSAKVEFLMAIVGPLSSIAIAFACYGTYLLGLHSGWPESVDGVVHYLWVINGLLAAFNLLPAFPLDGGRALRAILWGLRKNLRWATRVSSSVGFGFGILFILLGVFQFLTGNVVGGIWLFLIGMFLQNAARMSYQQLVIRKALEGEPVSRFMKTDPVAVSPSTSIQQLVEDYVYKYHFQMFPITEGSEKLVGCITTKELKEIPREEWGHKTVGEVATKCSAENTIEPQADATQALSLMARTGSGRLIVVEGNRLVGVITLKDMLKFLSLKMELER